MKVFAIYGLSKSGKTESIERIIYELKRRGYKVGAIKKSYHHDVEYDKKGKDTYRMEQSGADIVGGLSRSRAALFYNYEVKPLDFIKLFNTDYLIIEGRVDIAIPKIFSAASKSELEELNDPLVFAITGKISESMEEYKGIPVINALKKTEDLVDLIENKVFPLLPQINCEECGFDCAGMAERILKGEKDIRDCVILQRNRVKIMVGKKPMYLAPFLENMLINIVRGFLSPLKGYEDGQELHIRIEE